MAVVVFNPLACWRRDVASAKIDFGAARPAAIAVTSPRGERRPAQFNGAGDSVLFMASVPPLGYAVYLIDTAAAPPYRSALTITSDTLANARYTVSIDAQGAVAQIYDKRLRKNLLAAPSHLQQLNNVSNVFPAWEIRLADIKAPPIAVRWSAPVTRIVERGPVRVMLEIRRSDDSPTEYLQYVSLTDDTAHPVVVETRIPNWQTGSVLLKAAFPLTASNSFATYDLGLGVVERPGWWDADTSRYEVPAQQWADISASDGSYGVSILSDYKSGWDNPGANILRLSLIHSPGATRYGYQGDIGKRHEFRYAFYAHAGGWRCGAVTAAERFNYPLMAFSETQHGGKLGKLRSFVSVNPAAATLMALKKAEKGDALILRIREIAGSATTDAGVAFGAPVAWCSESNGMEDVKTPLAVRGARVQISLKPFQPKTVAFSPNGRPPAVMQRPARGAGQTVGK
jgi:alpha-mannosidase